MELVPFNTPSYLGIKILSIFCHRIVTFCTSVPSALVPIYIGQLLLVNLLVTHVRKWSTRNTFDMNMCPKEGSIHSCKPDEGRWHEPKRAQILFLFGDARDCWIFLVLIMFSSSSQHFLNSSPLDPIFFALSSTLCKLYKQPKGRVFNISIVGLSNGNIIFFWQILDWCLQTNIFFGKFWFLSTNLTHFSKKIWNNSPTLINKYLNVKFTKILKR